MSYQGFPSLIITQILPYFGQLHEAAELMHSLSKKTHLYWYTNQVQICASGIGWTRAELVVDLDRSISKDLCRKATKS